MDSPWSPTALPGTELVSGPYGDQAADIHTGLPSNEVDFFPGFIPNPNGGPPTGSVPVDECVPGVSCHTVDLAPVPEPATLGLLGGALTAFGLIRRRKYRFIPRD